MSTSFSVTSGLAHDDGEEVLTLNMSTGHAIALLDIAIPGRDRSAGTIGQVYGPDLSDALRRLKPHVSRDLRARQLASFLFVAAAFDTCVSWS